MNSRRVGGGCAALAMAAASTACGGGDSTKTVASSRPMVPAEHTACRQLRHTEFLVEGLGDLPINGGADVSADTTAAMHAFAATLSAVAALPDSQLRASARTIRSAVNDVSGNYVSSSDAVDMINAMTKMVATCVRLDPSIFSGDDDDAPPGGRDAPPGADRSH